MCDYLSFYILASEFCGSIMFLNLMRRVVILCVCHQAVVGGVYPVLFGSDSSPRLGGTPSGVYMFAQVSE